MVRHKSLNTKRRLDVSTLVIIFLTLFLMFLGIYHLIAYFYPYEGEVLFSPGTPVFQLSGDFDGDGSNEIAIVDAGGLAEIEGYQTRQLKNVRGSDIRGDILDFLLVGDVDGDYKDEIIGLQSGTNWFYSWGLNNLGSTSTLIISLENDGGLYNCVRESCGTDPMANNFVNVSWLKFAVLGDFDGVGDDDLRALQDGTSWNYVWNLKVAGGNLTYSNYLNNTIGNLVPIENLKELRVGDYDSDGIADILGIQEGWYYKWELSQTPYEANNFCEQDNVCKKLETSTSCPVDCGDLMAYFDFDDNSYDHSGRGNNGHLNGNIYYSEGLYGNAAVFDGDGDYMDIFSTHRMMEDHYEHSIETWVEWNRNSGDKDCIFREGNTPYGYELCINENLGEIVYSIKQASTRFNTMCSRNLLVPNDWNYIVATFDGQNRKINLYVNGVKCNSTDVSDYFIYLDDSSANWSIGGHPTIPSVYDASAQNYFNGSIDELKIWKRVLGDIEIKSNYDEVKNGSIPGLISHWEFDDDLTDSVGDNDGVSYGNPSFVDGIDSKSMKFDGDGDYVAIDDNESLNIGVGSWEAWIKSDRIYSYGPTSRQAHILSKNNTYAGAYLIGVEGSMGNKVYCQIRLAQDSSQRKVIYSNFPLDKSWHQVVCAYDGINLKMYIDGELQSDTLGISGTLDISNSDKLYIGANPNILNENMFNGSIDNVRIWSRALSDDEIKESYDEFGEDADLVLYYPFDSDSLDHSLYNHPHSLIGGEYISGRETGSNALKFDGINDYLNTTYQPYLTPNTFTIASWLKVLSVNSTGRNTVFGSIADVGSDSHVLFEFAGNICGLGKIAFRVKSDQGTIGDVVCFNQSLLDNNWHHVAAVYGDGGYMKVYLDGILVNFTSITSESSGGKDFNNYSFYVGGVNNRNNRSLNSAYFNGSIDELKVWNKALTAQEIFDEFNQTTSCVPSTCIGLGYSCGTWVDSCGDTVNCGSCNPGYTCNSNGQCIYSCTPTTCSVLGYSCGTWANGCGGTVNCGTCSTGQVCNSTSGQCIIDCGATCASLGYVCGNYTVCGNQLTCGTCSEGLNCTSNGQCVSSCVPNYVWNVTGCVNDVIVNYSSDDLNDCNLTWPANQTIVSDCDGNNLFGTFSDIDTQDVTFNYTIDGATVNYSRNYSGNLTVKFINDGIEVIEFDWNFDEEDLDLRDIYVRRQDNNDGYGYLIVRGLEVGKTFIIDKINGNSDSVCVHDRDNVDRIGEVDDDCTGYRENFVLCDGLRHNGFICRISGDIFIVDTLYHSAVMEMLPLPGGTTVYCGDGTCNTNENCSTCSRDCGDCSSGGPTPYCGDGSCNNNEDCGSCSRDCGACEPVKNEDIIWWITLGLIALVVIIIILLIVSVLSRNRNSGWGSGASYTSPTVMSSPRLPPRGPSNHPQHLRAPNFRYRR